VVSDRQGRWIFVGLRELVGETCIGEYVTARTQAGMRAARRFAAEHRAATGSGLAERIQVLTPEKFGRKLTNICYRCGWPLVGLNLPWVFSRFAATATAARKARRGRRHDFVLILPGCSAPSRKQPGRRRDSFYRPRLFMDARGPGLPGAFFAWETPRDPHSRRRDGKFARRGRFVDLAVTGGTLAGRDLDKPEKIARSVVLCWPKPIDDNLERLRAEMSAVVEIFLVHRRLLASLGVAPWKARSTGSLVAAALDHTGAVPPLAKLAGVAPELRAAMAATLLGGDTSARLCQQVVPAVLLDRNGDYCRGFSAIRLQCLLSCERIRWEPVDPDWLRFEVSTLTPDLCALGLVFAIVRPAREVLPSRPETRPEQRRVRHPHRPAPLRRPVAVPRAGLSVVLGHLRRGPRARAGLASRARRLPLEPAAARVADRAAGGSSPRGSGTGGPARGAVAGRT
jgi:hypothetical protein